MYTSLADYQIKKEETIQRNPLIMSEDEIEETPAEILYRVGIITCIYTCIEVFFILKLSNF